ncbi:major facilitator superfamily transporter [Lasiosphaeria miniovina]|uniref:Major facilitator superfamily transporter n=1 Tax=Lasiosphaeria miniovina TaxID=1954250 RepID=A0AA40B4W4_9PEZI|nr:major facilitator superfamily transporter [Lasiosphaeria miniovina]KAK0727592.1 major facilitator superfamily transporter [Lasiosphaeria miniovina]
MTGQEQLKNDIEADSDYKQHGVKKVEAVTTVWSSKMLWIVFALLYLVSFVDVLLQSVQGNLVSYITSEFSQHGLLAITSIVSSILGGAITPTIAKITDIRGRTEGFLYMLLLIVVGMIMKATCQNVETYAAAQTFYWVGHLGLLYIITIILSDMTSLRNRMIMISVNGTPLIASTFAGPKIAELFYLNLNFRWAFGAFTIILLAFCLPVALILLLSEAKAKKQGLIPLRMKTRSLAASFKYYFVEFDVVGLLLLTAGWSLLLLPFSLVSSALHGWQSATVICMIVFGIVSLGLFVVWEKFFAAVSLFPYKFLKDRTVLGASFAYGIMFLSIFVWDTYYYSYLQVAHFQDIASAGYILNTFSLTSAIISPLISVFIRYTGQFKWPTIIVGIPFVLLGTGLLIHFRTPSTSVGFLVMCQFFNGLGTSFIATCGQLAVMAAVTHQEVAIALAFFNLCGSIGAAIGMAIAGGLWTNLLRNSIYDNLPAASKELTDAIYADMRLQLSYERGDPIRDAIIEAYGDVQRKMVIAGAAFVPLLLGAVLIWRDINVKEKRQTVGNVW